jgi:hypothetical protein
VAEASACFFFLDSAVSRESASFHFSQRSLRDPRLLSLFVSRGHGLQVLACQRSWAGSLAGMLPGQDEVPGQSWAGVLIWPARLQQTVSQTWESARA